MADKVTLITGTSTGLGIAIAVQAATAGHRVYATMRDLSKREKLDQAAAAAGVQLVVLRLDVLDSATVAAAVDEVIAREGRIDILVNNAGAGFVRSVEQATEDEIRWVVDVNFMGVARCTKAVMPYMRHQGNGHVVTISSIGGLVGQPFNEIYCAAKFAVEGFMESMASYITPAFGVKFSVIEPGGIASDFAANVLEQMSSTGGILNDAYRPMLERYIAGSRSRQGGDIYQTPDQVAEVVLSVMKSPMPPLRTRTSKWSEYFCRLKTGLDPDGTMVVMQAYEQFLDK